MPVAHDSDFGLGRNRPWRAGGSHASDNIPLKHTTTNVPTKKVYRVPGTGSTGYQRYREMGKSNGMHGECVGENCHPPTLSIHAQCSKSLHTLTANAENWTTADKNKVQQKQCIVRKLSKEICCKKC